MYITNPRGDVTITAYPDDYEFSGYMEQPGSIVASFFYAFDSFVNQDSVTNPIQDNGFVRVVRIVDGVSQTTFIGTIDIVDLAIEEDGQAAIEIIATDPLAKLNDTVASVAGISRGTFVSPSATLSQESFLQGPGIGESDYIFHPEPTSTAWLPISLIGTATGVATSGTVLQDSGANHFVSGRAYYNQIIRNDTDGSYARIVTVDSASQITHTQLIGGTKNEWTVADVYTIEGTPFTVLGSTTLGDGSYAITGMNNAGAVGTHWFEIAGDKTPELLKKFKIEVTGAVGYDGEYIVVSSSEAAGTTSVVVEEAIPGGSGGTLNNRCIIGTAFNEGMLVVGMGTIQSEWFFYDGRDYSDLHSAYIHKNVRRGVLGTTAASHVAGNPIHQQVAQKIHPAVAVKIEARETGGPDWDVIKESQYHVQTEDGRIDFLFDVLGYPSGSPKYDQIRVSYGIFDETNDSAIKIDQSIIIPLLEESKDLLGPGLTSADYEVDIADLRMTRVTVKKVTSTIELMRQILEEVGLVNGEGTAQVSFWYGYDDEKFKVKSLIQKTRANADFKFATAKQIAQTFSLEKIYSAVDVTRRRGITYNLAQPPARIWHPQIGEGVGSNGIAVQWINYQDNEREKGYGWEIDGTVTHQSVFSKYMVDGSNDTGFGFRCATAPGNNTLLCYLVLNDDISLELVDTMKVVLDCRREVSVEAGEGFKFEVFGHKTYTPGNPPTVSTGIPLSGGLTLELEPGNTDSMGEIVLEAKGIGQRIRVVSLVYSGFQTDDAHNSFFGRVKEVSIRGPMETSEQVKLTDDETKDSSFLYYKRGHTKLIDAALGMHKTDFINIGVGSKATARSLGRLKMLANLTLDQVRSYQILDRRDLKRIPERGDTALTPEGFVGVALGVKHTLKDAKEEVILRVQNFAQRLL